MSNCGVPGHVTGHWDGNDLSSWRCLDCHQQIHNMKTHSGFCRYCELHSSACNHACTCSEEL